MYDINTKNMISYMISESLPFLHNFDIIKIHDIIYDITMCFMMSYSISQKHFFQSFLHYHHKILPMIDDIAETMKKGYDIKII
jgi:hypothetical protein